MPLRLFAGFGQGPAKSELNARPPIGRRSTKSWKTNVSAACSTRRFSHLTHLSATSTLAVALDDELRSSLRPNGTKIRADINDSVQLC